MTLSGNLDPAFDMPFAGIRFVPGQTTRPPANLTSASGVRFLARGKPGSYNFGAGSDGRFAPHEFKLGQNWQEITIRFADLKDFDPAKTDFLEIAAGYHTGPYQFELADVRLFKE